MNLKDRVCAIVPAAGLGRRLKSKVPKPFVQVGGKPLFIHTLLALKKSYPFSEFILAADKSQMAGVKRQLRRFGFSKALLVAGGRTRAESVKNALQKVPNHCGWVLVHDAARPLVSRELVRQTLSAAGRTGAAIAALPACATVKRVHQETVLKTEDRRHFYLAQTPQVFRRDLLVKRYRALGRSAFKKTDEAALFDGTRVKVKVTPGEARNIKVTMPEDLELVKFYLK